MVLPPPRHPRSFLPPPSAQSFDPPPNAPPFAAVVCRRAAAPYRAAPSAPRRPCHLFAVPPAVRYRRAAVPPLLQCRARRAVCPAVRCPACRLLPPRRLTADPYRAAPPLHTHLTFCSTEFALMSEPSRRVPRSGLAGPEHRPRVLRSSLAGPERRPARWGASLGPIRGSSLAPSACASAVVI